MSKPCPFRISQNCIDVISWSKLRQVWLRFAHPLFDLVPVTNQRTSLVSGGQVRGQADSYPKLPGAQVRFQADKSAGQFQAGPLVTDLVIIC